MKKKITNHTNHTIILRTFHYYCYKALHYILLFTNKVLYYMGFHFLVLKFLIMILWFMICVIAIFLLHCQPLCFSVLLLRRQVRWDFLLVGTVVFGAIFLWDSRLWVFLQNLLLVYPEKCWFLRESWLTLQKEKEKKASPASPPTPLRVERGVIREIPLSWW